MVPKALIFVVLLFHCSVGPSIAQYNQPYPGNQGQPETFQFGVGANVQVPNPLHAAGQLYDNTLGKGVDAVKAGVSNFLNGQDYNNPSVQRGPVVQPQGQAYPSQPNPYQVGANFNVQTPDFVGAGKKFVQDTIGKTVNDVTQAFGGQAGQQGGQWTPPVQSRMGPQGSYDARQDYNVQFNQRYPSPPATTNYLPPNAPITNEIGAGYSAPYPAAPAGGVDPYASQQLPYSPQAQYQQPIGGYESNSYQQPRYTPQAQYQASAYLPQNGVSWGGVGVGSFNTYSSNYPGQYNLQYQGQVNPQKPPFRLVSNVVRGVGDGIERGIQVGTRTGQRVIGVGGKTLGTLANTGKNVVADIVEAIEDTGADLIGGIKQ